MADNDRNQRRGHRSSNQDWDNENYGNQNSWENQGSANYGAEGNRGWDYTGDESRHRQHEGYQGNLERGRQQNRQDSYNKGYGNSGSQNKGSGGYYGSGAGTGSWGSGNYNSGSSDYDQDLRHNENQNYGYGGREFGSSYGGGNYDGNSSYYGSGSQGNRRPSYGSSRNLYDRDYEGYNRGMSNNSGMGGANYGVNEGRRRENDRGYSGYSDSNYGGNFYEGDQRRGYGHGDKDDRSWWDRTKDEVSSWFGDDEAERRRSRDRQLNFRGKGPKNYSRSDDRIKEDINDRLSDDPWVDASEIDVTVTKGEVTLSGTVNDRNDKRRAEDLAEAVSGVKHVENRLRVGIRQQSGVGTGSSIGTSSMPGSTISPGSYGGETSATQTGVTGTTTNTGKTK